MSSVTEYYIGGWRIVMDGEYIYNLWQATHDSYDGPEHPGFVYGPDLDDVLEQISVIEEEGQIR